MKEIKKIKKYLADEKITVLQEIDYYKKLKADVSFQIEHSSRFVLKMATSKSDDMNLFSPYGKDLSENLEEENMHIDSLTRQNEVIEDNLKKQENRLKALEAFITELDKFSEREYFFVYADEYDKVQTLLDQFREEIELLQKDFERKLKQFALVDPNRILVEYKKYKKDMDEKLQLIGECEKILRNNRLDNR